MKRANLHLSNLALDLWQRFSIAWAHLRGKEPWPAVTQRQAERTIGRAVITACLEYGDADLGSLEESAYFSLFALLRFSLSEADYSSVLPYLTPRMRPEPEPVVGEDTPP